MTGAMILFAFVMSLGVNLIEKHIIPDNPYTARKKDVPDIETANDAK